MRISDWSSDVCSSDLGYATNLCPHYRTPRLQWEAMIPSLMLRPAPVAERRWRVCRQVRANGRVRRGMSQGPGSASAARRPVPATRSEEHTSELQSLMRISYAVLCLKKKTQTTKHQSHQ